MQILSLLLAGSALAVLAATAPHVARQSIGSDDLFKAKYGEHVCAVKRGDALLDFAAAIAIGIMTQLVAAQLGGLLA